MLFIPPSDPTAVTDTKNVHRLKTIVCRLQRSQHEEPLSHKYTADNNGQCPREYRYNILKI
jgi:hypothetical protein